MKLTKSLMCVAMAGTMAFAAGNAAAQLAKLNISGSLTYQKDTTSSGSVYKYTTGKVSFKNSTIIALLNQSPEFTDTLGTIPAGAYLVWDENTRVLWTNATTHASELISGQFYNADYDDYFTFISFNNGSSGVRTGTYNSSTGQDNEKGMGPDMGLYIDDYEGDYIQIYGIGNFSYSASKISGGFQTVKASGTIKGSGYGEFDYADAVTQGTVKASGSGSVPADE